MRVGLVAKGLLLKGDLDLELVLLCKEKPTTALLDKVADNLAIQLAVSMNTSTGVEGGLGVLVEDLGKSRGAQLLGAPRGILQIHPCPCCAHTLSKGNRH